MIVAHEQSGVPLAWAPGSDWIAFAANPGVVTIARVVATDSGALTEQVGHLTMRKPVQSLSVSRDGRWLAAGHPEGGVSVHAVDLEAHGAWREVSRGSVPIAFEPTHDGAALTLVEFSPVEDTLVVVCGRLVNWIRVDREALEAALAAAEPAATPASPPPEAEGLPLSVLTVRIEAEGSAWSFSAVTGDGMERQELLRPRRNTQPDLRSLLGLDARIVPGLRAMSPQAAGAVAVAQELLFPPGLLEESVLARDKAPLLLRLDPSTASSPWELLLRSQNDSPWAVSRGIVRLPLQDPGFRVRLPDPSPALVMSAPPGNPGGQAVAGRLVHAFGDRVAHVAPSRRRLRERLETDVPRLLAILGEADVRERASGGPALFLSADEEPLTLSDFAAGSVPELVFIGHPYSSGWSELLELGVRVVVTLDWRIDEEGAAAFTDEFMRSLAGGATLVEASRMGRQYAYTRHAESSAWAAFRCHGDPFYRLSGTAVSLATAPVDLSPLAPPSERSETVRLTATPGEDLVLLDIQDGPQLALHPQTAKDLMTETGAGLVRNERSASRSTGGWLGTVLLKTLQVVTGMEGAADPARLGELAARVDSASPSGMFALSSSGWPPTPRPASAVGSGDAVTLVLVHGLMLTGAETFASLWSDHPDEVARLFKHYGERVLSLEHATLGSDPLDAARQLAQACASGARLHLLTHSSGGLVAEALVRATADDATSTGALEGLEAGGADVEPVRSRIEELVSLVRARRLRIERVVRVACPARGTLLASGRLDAFLSVFSWAQKLAGTEQTAARNDLLMHVAVARSDVSMLPGLAALRPDAALVKWLNDGASVASGDLRVVAGDLNADSASNSVKRLLSDAYYWTDNDLIVQTRSMYGGVRREPGATFFLESSGQASHFNYFRNASTVRAIVDGLMLDQPDVFRTVGPLSWSGESGSGDR